MSRPGSLKKGDVIDASVSAVYQNAVHPTVPTRLDRAVLDLAAREAGGRSWLAVTNLWLRPVTYVATLGLCVVLLTNIENVPETTSLYDVPPTANPFAAEEPTPGESSAFRNAANQAARQIQDAELNNGASLGQTPEVGSSEISSAQSNSAKRDSCSVDQRLSAEQWHACIVELQAAGADNAAARETGLLRDAFPDYRLEAVQ